MPLFAQRQIIKHGQPADNKVTTRKCYQLNKEVHKSTTAQYPLVMGSPMLDMVI